MYNNIYNPNNREVYKLNSKKGIKLLKNYINLIITGSSLYPRLTTLNYFPPIKLKSQVKIHSLSLDNEKYNGKIGLVTNIENDSKGTRYTISLKDDGKIINVKNVPEKYVELYEEDDDDSISIVTPESNTDIDTNTDFETYSNKKLVDIFDWCRYASILNIFRLYFPIDTDNYKKSISAILEKILNENYNLQGLDRPNILDVGGIFNDNSLEISLPRILKNFTEKSSLSNIKVLHKIPENQSRCFQIGAENNLKSKLDIDLLRHGKSITERDSNDTLNIKINIGDISQKYYTSIPKQALKILKKLSEELKFNSVTLRMMISENPIVRVPVIIYKKKGVYSINQLLIIIFDTKNIGWYPKIDKNIWQNKELTIEPYNKNILNSDKTSADNDLLSKLVLGSINSNSVADYKKSIEYTKSNNLFIDNLFDKPNNNIELLGIYKINSKINKSNVHTLCPNNNDTETECFIREYKHSVRNIKEFVYADIYDDIPICMISPTSFKPENKKLKDLFNDETRDINIKALCLINMSLFQKGLMGKSSDSENIGIYKTKLF